MWCLISNIYCCPRREEVFFSWSPYPKDKWEQLWKFLFSSSLYSCEVKLFWTILSYLNFFLLKPSDRLSSFPLETTENMFWLSGHIWIHKRKVSTSDRQQSDTGQICLAFESAGLFKINFIEEFCREYFSYTRVLLVWRPYSSFTKNKLFQLLLCMTKQRQKFGFARRIVMALSSGSQTLVCLQISWTPW